MPAWAWACPEEGAVRRSLVARLPFSPAATRRGRSGRPQLRGTYQTCSTTPGVRTFNSDLPIDDQPRLQPERREQALPLTIATFAQTAPTLPGTQHQCRRAVACTPRSYSRHGRDLSCRAPALAQGLGLADVQCEGPAEAPQRGIRLPPPIYWGARPLRRDPRAQSTYGRHGTLQMISR